MCQMKMTEITLAFSLFKNYEQINHTQYLRLVLEIGLKRPYYPMCAQFSTLDINFKFRATEMLTIISLLPT